MQGVYSIKDLEKISGIKAHTLRIWEQRYNILEPKRTKTNIRYYDRSDLKKLLNISILNCNGVKISKISQMTQTEIREKVIELHECCDQYANQVNGLTLAMLDLDEGRFENVLNKNILQLGFEDCMINVIYPFFERVGILWQTGTINPAQEHFVSNLVRQKLLVAIDGQSNLVNDEAAKYLLFLPAGEMHELSLLFANYILKSRGMKVVYLGQSLPVEDLPKVVDLYQPDYIFTILTTLRSEKELEKFVKNLSNTFKDRHILMAGKAFEDVDFAMPSNAQGFSAVREFIDYLS